MAIPSQAPRQIAPSSAFSASSALCDEAVRRCSTQHGLPVTPSDELRQRAWQLCWLAIDAASAPANNLPEIADAKGWPHELVAQLRAAPALPKLNTQTWQALRRMRDGQLLTAPGQAAEGDAIADGALAELLEQSFEQADLEPLRAWVTPSRAALLTHWLSACLLALDAQALSDDDSDAGALELTAFVQATLQRVQGAVLPLEDAVQREPEQPAAVSSKREPEQSAAVRSKRQPEQPAAVSSKLEPQQPAAVSSKLEPQQPAAVSSEREPEQPAAVSGQREPAAEAETVVAHAPAAAVPVASTPQTPARVAPLGRRAIVPAVAVVAVAALLLLMFRSGNTPQPEATQPTRVAAPAAVKPEPSAHVVTPKPPPEADELPSAEVEPIPSAPQRVSKQTTTTTQRPRYRTVTAAKRALAAKKIDDTAYAAAIAELEALRATRIAKEQQLLRSGKLKQADYQRRVDAINKNLGFDRRSTPAQ